MAYLEFNNKEFVDNLRKLGLHDNKTFTIKPPENIPKEYLPYFVMGLIDGDGSVYILNRNINNKIYKYLLFKYTGNVYMTNFVSNYIKNIFNIEPQIELNSKKDLYRKNKIYNIRYFCKNSVDILNYLYSFNNKYRLKRKYLIYKEYIENYTVK